MSKTDTWMPLYIGDYLADTMHLNTAQHGAYMLLLMHHWRVGPLPNDDCQLSAIARCEVGLWKRAFAPVIRNFFSVEGATLVQKRLMAEREFAEDLTETRSKAGKAGAAKRWAKKGDPDSGDDGNSNGKPDSKSIANAMAKPSQVDAPLPSPSPKERTYPADTAPAVAAAADPPDLKTQVWRDGKRIVSSLTGQPEREAGAFVGRIAGILKQDFAGMLAIFREAERLRPLDPSAWMMAAAQARTKQSVSGATPRQEKILRAAGLWQDGEAPIIDVAAFNEPGRLLQ
jgi:uncharacterized protein YdaU (DUF1376 family)